MIFEMARISVVIGILAISTYYDIYNNKNVPDIIYRAGIVLGAIFLIFDNPWGWIPVIGSIGLSVIVGMGLFIVGAWGGADAKIMFAITVLHPIWSSPFPYEKMALHPFTAIIMMSNAAMIAGLVYLPIVIFKRNTKMKIAFLPFLSLGYLFTILKGDILLWIKKYIFLLF